MPAKIIGILVTAGFWAAASGAMAQEAKPAMDRDMIEVTVPQLHSYYADHKYSVTQVVQWYLDRIKKYDGIYKAVETVMAKEALADAAEEDADKSGTHGPLWGVPIVIKANTSIAGQITTNGWAGFTMKGHELFAPKDAPVVAKLRAAGAIIIGHTNMPDFANSDESRSTSFGRTGDAYDLRFSPGGSSSGTVTSVSANMAMMGTGTDTANSIRMPVATSALVGVFPTRGLVPIAGIAPLDWMLDNTGPIARNVSDAATMLGVMAGKADSDAPLDRAPPDAQKAPYTNYLKPGSLKGKRIGVPAFILRGTSTPFHGTPASVPAWAAEKRMIEGTLPLEDVTRAGFMKDLDELRAAGATIVMDDGVLNDDFVRAASRIATYSYTREGMEHFLREYGPTQYHSIAEYQKATGRPIPPNPIGEGMSNSVIEGVRIPQREIETDPDAQANYFEPRKKALAIYLETMDRLKLDAYVYPAIQMPPPDDTMPQDGKLSGGPHSDTGWVNMLGVPAVVAVGGFYPGGLPYGLEFSGRPWRDGDLLNIAYGYEQATHHRHPPVLVEQGLLANAP